MSRGTLVTSRMELPRVAQDIARRFRVSEPMESEPVSMEQRRRDVNAIALALFPASTPRALSQRVEFRKACTYGYRREA